MKQDPPPDAPRRPQLHIACWEALWSEHYRDRASVLPTLELLQRLGWIEFTHRPAITLDQVAGEVHQWLKEPQELRSLLYLAGHGGDGHFAGFEPFAVEEFGERMSGALGGRILHIGSCSSALDATGLATVLRQLKRRTGASKVTGYATDVDWVESAAFETLLFSVLAWYTQPAAALRFVTENYGQLAERLGFVSDREQA